MMINTLSSVQSKLGLLDRLSGVAPHDEILILQMTFWSKSGLLQNATVEILPRNIQQKEIMRWEAFWTWMFWKKLNAGLNILAEH